MEPHDFRPDPVLEFIGLQPESLERALPPELARASTLTGGLLVRGTSTPGESTLDLFIFSLRALLRWPRLSCLLRCEVREASAYAGALGCPRPEPRASKGSFPPGLFCDAFCTEILRRAGVPLHDITCAAIEAHEIPELVATLLAANRFQMSPPDPERSKRVAWTPAPTLTKGDAPWFQ